MTVTIVGVKSFKILKGVYETAGVSSYSSTKIDLLKKLISLAGNTKEMEELRGSIIILKKYYNSQENINYVIRSDIKEAILAFQNKIEKLKNNGNEEIGLVGPQKIANNLILINDNLDYSRIDKIFKDKEFLSENQTEIEVIINKHLNEKESHLQKYFYLKKIESIDVSFDEMIILYREYSKKGEPLRKVLFEKMFKKAETIDDWRKLYGVTGKRNKHYQTILKNTYFNYSDFVNEKKDSNIIDTKLMDINDCLGLFLKNKSKINKSIYLKKINDINISFDESYILYKKYKKIVSLRNIFFKKMLEQEKTLEENIKIYNLINSRNPNYKKIVNDIIKLIKTAEDLEKIKKIVPKTTKLWYEIVKTLLIDNLL